MGICDKFLDLVVEIPIVEQAMERKEALRDIRALSRPIVEHLVKVFYWEDKLNYQKHIKDINNWIEQVYDIKVKSGKLSAEQYYNSLFSDLYEPRDDKQFLRIIKRLDYNHPRTDVEYFELFDIVQNILKQVSEDLFNNTFETVEDYIK